MKTQVFQSDEVAVIGFSSILPGAKTPEEFWKICRDEGTQFGEISDARLRHHILHESEETSLKITSHLACEISVETLKELSANSKLPKEKKNRLSLYAEYAAREIFNKLPGLKMGRHQDIVIGCMNPDTLFEFHVAQEVLEKHTEEFKASLGGPEDEAVLDDLIKRTFIEPSKNHPADKDHFFTTSILARIARDHGLTGEQVIVDSACASSLSAIDLAVQRLRLGLSDFSIAGGFESNLGAATYLVFSSVGALAPRVSKPFDPTSEGLVQSEGVVLFGLKRLSDALNDGDHIHGIIRSVAGSADGRAASLFQPNKEGQIRVYEQVHKKNRNLHYLEAHGTGTQVGDQTEAESIRDFFKGQSFPVGSVKSKIGHTKGTAGATGLLKCLHIIRDRVVPPSDTIGSSNLLQEDGQSPFINSGPVELPVDEPIRIGINAFGFGGTNFHLLLEEFKPEATVVQKTERLLHRVGVITEHSMSLENFEREHFLDHDCPFKLPPKSVSGIDKTQLVALLTAWECIRQTGPLWNWIPKKKISVVSACTLALDQVFDIANLMTFESIVRMGESENKHPASVAKLRRFVKEEIEIRYPTINEDAATGILNNVIAGRVSNAFDLHGKSYNIDKDLGSVESAREVIFNELQFDPEQVFLLIGVQEELHENGLRPKRKSVFTELITTESFAFQCELNFAKELQR